MINRQNNKSCMHFQTNLLNSLKMTSIDQGTNLLKEQQQDNGLGHESILPEESEIRKSQLDHMVIANDVVHIVCWSAKLSLHHHVLIPTLQSSSRKSASLLHICSFKLNPLSVLATVEQSCVLRVARCGKSEKLHHSNENGQTLNQRKFKMKSTKACIVSILFIGLVAFLCFFLLLATVESVLPEMESGTNAWRRQWNA